MLGRGITLSGVPARMLADTAGKWQRGRRGWSSKSKREGGRRELPETTGWGHVPEAIKSDSGRECVGVSN